MGGSRAKENRRLKRQVNRDKIGIGGESTGTVPTTTNRRLPKRPSSSADKRNNGNSNSSVRNSLRQNSNRITKPAKKKTSKKPKHLKRKLADATDATEEVTLRQKLADFEHRKEEWITKKIKFSVEPRKILKESVPTASSKHRTDNPKVAASSSSVEISTTITRTRTNTPTPTSKDPSSSSQTSSTKNKRKDSDESSSEDDDDDKPIIQKRQRGKRRRGRKDTSQKVAEAASEATKSPVTTASTSTLHQKDDGTNPTTKPKRGKPDRDLSRYCIGRKPITDFEVGKSYQGTVKYVKSFGIFLDINCHLDAFCHVSWLQDDYVEDPTALFQEGDEVRARVVEIDRERKRITVSMQSESFMEMELKSLGSNKDYKDKKAQKPSSRQRVPRNTNSGNDRATATIQTEKRSLHTGGTSTQNSSTVSSPTDAAHHQRFAPSGSGSNAHQPTGTKTPAELKRERKLARRAERRAKKGQENSTADASQ